MVAADLASQRLYRVQVRRKGSDANLRVVLRLAAEERFEVVASDAFGRKLWALTVDDGHGRWLAGGAERGCRLDPDRPVHLAELDWGLPARDLAAALVGRLPEAPPDSGDSGAVEYVDGDGRHWSARRDGVGPVRWSLNSGTAGLSWVRTERGGELVAAAAELRIRWSEVTREPLVGEGPRLSAAAAAEPVCGDADLS